MDNKHTTTLSSSQCDGFFNPRRTNTLNTLNYKGYTAKIEFDPEDNILFGNIIGISDTVGFHRESVRELKEAFTEAVDFYFESCKKADREPNKHQFVDRC